MILRSFILSGFTMALLATNARAQEAPPPTVVVVRPAREPVPALRYHLLPPAGELIPGNAAVFYHRAIEKLLRDTYGRQLRALKMKQPPEAGPGEDQVMEWLAMPAAKLPRDAVGRLVEEHRRILDEVELGALREDCDWEFGRRNEGYDLNIEDIQETRRLGRLVALRARFEIAEGRVDPAIHWIRTGLALARHVGESRIYIQSLIAAAITDEMAKAIEELIQAPGCPNLYWALAALPRPFIDVTAATEAEGRLIEREFPRLRGIETAVWSIEQARAFGDEIEQKGGYFLGRWTNLKSTLTRPTFDDLAEHLIVAGVVARAYPESKRALVASGISPDRVEAMPAIQVVAIHSYRIFEEKRDELFKWASLPISQGSLGMIEAEKKIFADPSVGIPFTAVLPGIRFAVFGVPVRIDRRLAAIRTIEALCLYAATHNGSPPPTLEALVDSPAPLDPATGRPFAYEVDGSTVSLSAPPPPGLEGVWQYAVLYQIKIIR